MITIPCKYKVGTNCLDVLLNGQKLLLSSDVDGTDGYYLEVAIPNSQISNQICLTNDWGIDTDSIAKGRIFEFVVRR